jgi:octopine/nopaline transport system permease protein
VVRALADGYTTVLRGIPDLLVIYLFYFGGSAVLGKIGSLFGYDGFIGLPAFATGAVAIGVVSAAYQAEVFRGAFQTVSRGEIEAAKSVGMHRFLMFRRIIAPQVLRYAIPGLGNVWQLVLKESALISVTGLVELLRQSNIAAGSTRRPFDFFLTAAAIYLVITWVSTLLFQRAETYSLRGVRRAA